MTPAVNAMLGRVLTLLETKRDYELGLEDRLTQAIDLFIKKHLKTTAVSPSNGKYVTSDTKGNVLTINSNTQVSDNEGVLAPDLDVSSLLITGESPGKIRLRISGHKKAATNDKYMAAVASVAVPSKFIEGLSVEKLAQMLADLALKMKPEMK